MALNEITTSDEAQQPHMTPSRRRHISEWAKLIAITGSVQVIVQAIGFISGILVIRLLPTHEYALYVLANTMLGAMTLLADGGIVSGVMSQGGKVWQDKQKLGAVLVTGMQLRKKFAVFSLIVAIPVLFFLLRKHDASWLMSSLIVLSLIPAFFTSLSGTLLEIAPKLQQDIAPLQKIRVIATAGRLALLSLTLFVYPFAALAIACAGSSQLWSNWRLRKISHRYIDRSQPPDSSVRAEILGNVKRIMPGAVYYCISGQITIWLLSIFGSTEAVAQIGGLGRLTMILNIFTILLDMLVVPRFAGLPNNRKLLLARFLQIQVGLLALNVSMVTIIWLFPNQILLILGENYVGLTSEVVLMAIVGGLGLMSSSSYHLSVSRGVVINPMVSIPILLFVQIAALFILHISTVMDALYYALIFITFEFIIRFTNYLKHIY